MKSLKESILGSTKTGKAKVYQDNPELFLRDVFGGGDELDIQPIRNQENAFSVIGNTKKKEIVIDEFWPDIKIANVWVTDKHLNGITYKISGQKAFEKFITIFSNLYSYDFFGQYNEKFNFQNTKFIFENCNVDHDKLPKLAGIIKFKKCNVNLNTSEYNSKIRGEIHLQKCDKVELPLVFNQIYQFKRT